MKLINLTPHAVNILTDKGVVRLPRPTGEIPQASASRKRLADVFHGDQPIPVDTVVFGQVTGLPDPLPDTYYVVLRIVQLACPDRADLLCLGTIVRDRGEQPIGCRGLSA